MELQVWAQVLSTQVPSAHVIGALCMCACLLLAQAGLKQAVARGLGTPVLVVCILLIVQVTIVSDGGHLQN